MRINIQNETSYDISAYDEYIDLLPEVVFRIACKDSGLKDYYDSTYINVTYVDSDEIKNLNNSSRGIDKITDVLSFPMLMCQNGALINPISNTDLEFDESGNKLLMLGDIILCMDKAISQAEEYGHSLTREVVFLICHSMLHLIGYDHINSDNEKTMISLQKEIMDEIGLSIEGEDIILNNHKEDSYDLMINIKYPAGSIADHVGYVSILGRPNVGKSTLINYISGMKVAIVSHKPQTTRTNIRSIYNTDDSQIIFVDTAGVHHSKSKLGKIMLSNSFSSAKNSDVVLLIADGRFDKPGKIEEELLELCKSNNKKVILAINKSDDVKKESLLPSIANYSKLYNFEEIIPISAKTGDNVDFLLSKLAFLLPQGPRLFDSEYQTNQTERMLASELIREQVLHFVNQEIPHGVAVDIDSFEDKYEEGATDEYDRKIVIIKASIICDRNSHKSILIGKNGQMIKRIGTSSRISIERMLGTKCYLDLFIKVREDWSNNSTFLKQFGFQEEDPSSN